MNPESTAKKFKAYRAKDYKKPPAGRYESSKSSPVQEKRKEKKRKDESQCPPFLMDLETQQAGEIIVDVQDTIQQYISMIVRTRGFASVSANYRAFLIQDMQAGSLVDNYCVVQRRPVCTDGEEYMWLYTCSCDTSRAKVANNISLNYSSGDAIDQAYPECKHIECTKTIVKEVDDELQIDTQTEYNSESVICLSHTESTTTYHIKINPSKDPKMLCQRCRTGKCKQIHSLLRQSENDIVSRVQEFINEKVPETARYIPARLSTHKIPFSIDDTAVPNTLSLCECLDEKDETVSSLPVFKLNTVTQQEVKTYWYSGCKSYTNYDGYNEGVLNMGSYLIGHDVMRQYMKQYLTEGTSMASFYKEWVWSLLESGQRDIKEKLPYYRFKYAWYAWIDLVDIKYSEGFACPDCGDEPDMVIMDGVTIGIRKALLPWEKLSEKLHGTEKVYDGREHKIQFPHRTASELCLIHGCGVITHCRSVCYGFHLMDDVESPNIPFTILRTRFRQAPRVVIYDNSCNVSNYCLNRDPIFFKNTWFLVDRFHWCNHTGGPEGYSLGVYPQFKNINTQVAEQRNATLKKVKPMLSYMNFENFMKNCKLFIWFRSMVATATRYEDLPIKDFKFFVQLRKIYSTLTC